MPGEEGPGVLPEAIEGVEGITGFEQRRLGSLPEIRGKEIIAGIGGGVCVDSIDSGLELSRRKSSSRSCSVGFSQSLYEFRDHH